MKRVLVGVLAAVMTVSLFCPMKSYATEDGNPEGSGVLVENTENSDTNAETDIEEEVQTLVESAQEALEPDEQDEGENETVKEQEQGDSEEIIETENPELEVLEDALVSEKQQTTEEIDGVDLNAVLEEKTQEYKSAEVPQIYIQTADGNGNRLEKSTGYVEATVAVIDVDGNVLSGDASIKVRGNTTAGAPKKPFNIKFKSKQDVLGMGKAKKWCLLANCFDPTLMRNATALSMAQYMGLPYTSEYRFVELWLDGKFKGCYLLTEAVEAGKTRVDIDTDNGEFILEYEKQRVESDVTYLIDSNGLRFAFKDPDEPTSEQFDNVKNVMDKITSAVASGDYSKVEEVIDAGSFAKFLVFNDFICTYDFDFSSVYFFYKDGKLYAGPAWDYDLSSGNYFEQWRDNKEYIYNANVYRYLLKYEEFRRLLVATFNEYADYFETIASDGGFIDSMYNENLPAFTRNYNEAGWKVSKKYTYYQMQPLGTLEENVSFYKNWLRNRLALMRTIYVLSQPVDKFEIITEPEDYSFEAAGPEATFRVEASGKDLNYMWFVKTPKSGRFIKSGVNSPEYTCKMYNKNNGIQVYCVVTGPDGDKLTTRTATAIITKHELSADDIIYPSGKVIDAIAGKEATFRVEVNSSDSDLKYYWYVKNTEASGGDGKFHKTGCNEKEYTRTASVKRNGMQAYCVITDSNGNSVESEIITLNVTKK